MAEHTPSRGESADLFAETPDEEATAIAQESEAALERASEQTPEERQAELARLRQQARSADIADSELEQALADAGLLPPVEG